MIATPNQSLQADFGSPAPHSREERSGRKAREQNRVAIFPSASCASIGSFCVIEIPEEFPITQKEPAPTDFRLSGTSSEHSILNPWCHPVLCLHTLCEIPSYPRHCNVCQTSATTRSTSCVSFAVPSVVHLRISVLPGSHHPGLSASAPFA